MRPYAMIAQTDDATKEGRIPVIRLYTKAIKSVLLAMLFTLLLCQIGAAETATVNMTITDRVPPITVLPCGTESDDADIRAELGFYARENYYYLIMPSCSDLSNVRVRYTGDRQFYDEYTGTRHAPGSEFTILLNHGRNYVYEYDSETDTYVRYVLHVKKTENTAAMFFTLDGGDEALRRINLSKDNVETGTLLMCESDGTVLYDGNLTKVKGRGNSSYSPTGELDTKNSININLSKKAELIDNAGKSKKWSMIAIRMWPAHNDSTTLSFFTAFGTYNALVRDQYYNMCARLVDVYINGGYRGTYLLTERMDVGGSIGITNMEKEIVEYDENCAVVRAHQTDDPLIQMGVKQYSYADNAVYPEDVDITGGYVLELSMLGYGQYGFRTAHDIFINIKSPDHPNQAMVQYIAGYVQNFENALFSPTGYNELGRHYSEYIDESSFTSQILVYAYYLNWEAYRTSTYIYKDRDDSAHPVLTFGPVWDFETGHPYFLSEQPLFVDWYFYTDPHQHVWMEQLWQKGEFLHLLTEKNNEMREVLDVLLSHKEGDVIVPIRDTMAEILPSQQLNWFRWPYQETFEHHAEKMLEGLDLRYNSWYNRIWADNAHLYGLTADAAAAEDGLMTLTATVYGKADSGITWYRIDPEDPTKAEAIGDGESITVDANGRYFASVEGPNNAYYELAEGAIFSRPTLRVISNPVDGSSLE